MVSEKMNLIISMEMLKEMVYDKDISDEKRIEVLNEQIAVYKECTNILEKTRTLFLEKVARK